MAVNDIIFTHVEKTYEKTKIIHDLNLTVREGERLVLLGPSGCGKSTTLRMIAGLEEITSGDLVMGGQRVNEIPSGKRNVSMVFQNYALYPHMTVADNITYALRVQKVEKRETQERLRNAMNILGLETYEKRKPRELSGGQRQRVALARALVKRSRYLLLDEPLSNLDAQLRVQARKELVKLHQLYGQTFIYVTHDQIEAMTVGNRIALMEGGVLQMIDTPYRVYNRPANIFAARFIGSPSTNIMEAEWEDGFLRIGDQRVELPKMWNRIAAAHGRKALCLGIRPEHLKLEAGHREQAFCGEIRYIEDYGNKLGIYFSLNGEEAVSICDAIPAGPGEMVSFVPDFNHIHLFDRETTRSLGYPEELECSEQQQQDQMRALLCEGSKAHMEQGEVIHVHR